MAKRMPRGRPPGRSSNRLDKEKQDKFVEEYVNTGANGVKAAKLAGYSSPAASASQALEREEVKQAIVEKAVAELVPFNVTPNEVLKGLVDEARGIGPDTTSSARITAWGLLAKLMGIEAPRQVDVRISGGLAAYQALDPSELDRRYREALGGS